MTPASTSAPDFGRHRTRDRLVRLGWALADAAAMSAAVFGASWLRYDFASRPLASMQLAQFAALAAIVHLVLGVVIGPYSVRHQLGSFEEAADLGMTVIATTTALAAAIWVGHVLTVPRSLPILAPLIALMLMFASRFVVRAFRWGRGTTDAENEQRVIVFGAGEGGRQLVRAMRRDRTSGHRYVPVAVLDDDPAKRRLRIDGVRVRGGRADLEAVVERTGAETLVVAIPSASAALMKQLHGLARHSGLEVLVLPQVAEMIGPAAGADLRQLNLEDLLGRHQVRLDAPAIADSIAGKRVLVTGAGGSIGSELCRQIAKFGPAKLVLLDRDESAMHSAQMSMTGRALLDDGTLALCDIRDLDALRTVFERERPQVVFHAAALKHLTLLELYPVEAWKSNVIGTHNVLTAAAEVGVETFVNISTDKAADPTCVLGYSKRIAERLTAGFARRDGGTFVSVRFGNVLGSRGSVITAFTAQIEAGKPVTVTHPDVERYFMLIPEACQLVLQAAAIGKDGDVMVLEMGEPVKILDVAKDLIELSGRHNIEIVFTGLRPGEKLTEDLFSGGEHAQQSEHPLVRHVPVPPLDGRQAVERIPHDDETALLWMKVGSQVIPAPPASESEPVPPTAGPSAQLEDVADAAAPARARLRLAPEAPAAANAEVS